MRWVAVILVCCPLAVRAIDTNAFTWPEGVSNRGPYTLATTTHSIVMTPSGVGPTENDLTSHRYHHVAKIAWDKDVTWIACNSAGVGEQNDGTQVHLFTSTNRGANWSAPVLVWGSLTPWSTNLISTTNSIWAIPNTFATYGGTNYLICDITQETPQTNWQSQLLVANAVLPSGAVGEKYRISPNNWTSPAGDENNNVPGLSNLTYNAALSASLLTQSKLYGTYGGDYGAPGTTTNVEWGTFLKTNSNTFIERNTASADGTTSNLYRIYRVLGGYTGGFTGISLVAMSWSTNGGASFCLPYPTAIPNADVDSSETTITRLLDGRFAIVGNPHIYETGNAYIRRDPLFMAITEPNTTTITNVTSIIAWQTNLPSWTGNSKSGGGQYPAIVQVSNYLYVTYSLQKERLGFSRVLIPGLADNNNDYWTEPTTNRFASITCSNLIIGQ